MKSEIRKTIESLAKSLDVQVKIEDDRVSMSPDQFVRLAMATSEEEDEEEDEEENGNGARKPPKRSRDLDPDMIKETIKDLEGEASSSEIREEILAKHGMRIPSATLRIALQGLIDKGEVTPKGEARGKTYLLKTAKGGKGK